MKQTQNTNGVVKRDGVEPAILRKQIGSTTYVVSVHFSQSCTETLKEKILRLIKNDLKSQPEHGIMKLPQTGRLPERSSI